MKAVGLSISAWSYSIEPAATDDRCVLTETWTDRRGGIARFFSKSASGVEDREVFSRQSIETTLANLAASVET